VTSFPVGYFFALRFAAQYFFIRSDTAFFAAADIRFRVRLDTGAAPPMTTSNIGDKPYERGLVPLRQRR